MSLILADTSAWSRFYRRDIGPSDPIGSALELQLAESDILTTGIVYLELLRGFTQPVGRSAIEVDFSHLVFIEPNSVDYAAAADLSVTCRRGGVQLETIDSLIAQICIANDLTLLTADTDFVHAARHIPLDVWKPK